MLLADLPAGRFRAGPGVWITDQPTWLTGVFDVLYGPLRPRQGVGRLEVQGTRGRYRIVRDLSAGTVSIETLEGRPPPDPRLISPGMFLLGTKRPAPPVEKGAPNWESRRVFALEVRRQRLLRTADTLERQGAQVAKALDSPQASLEDLARSIVTREAERLSEELARLDALQQWVIELDGPPGEREPPALELARRLEILARDAASQGNAAKSALGGSTAVVLAALGAGIFGHLRSEQLIAVFGWLVAASVGVCLLGFLLNIHRRRQRIVQRLAALRQRALEELARLGVEPMEGTPTPTELRKAVSRQNRRDRVAALKGRLVELLPDEEHLTTLKDERARLHRFLSADPIPGTIGANEDHPMLALVTSMRAQRERLAEVQRGALRQAEALGVRKGAARALRLEADRLGHEESALRRAERARIRWREDAEERPPKSYESVAQFLQHAAPYGRAWPRQLPEDLVPEEPRLLAELLEDLVTGSEVGVVIVPVGRVGSISEVLSHLPEEVRHSVGVLPISRREVALDSTATAGAR